MKRVCIFCGSSAGRRPSYGAAARRLGRLLGSRGMTLVYGGGSFGMMGEIADAALAAGAAVIGVIPEGLVERELAHQGLTELHVVPSLHRRKQMMADLAEGFIALPGGMGTLDELSEVWTWAQLGLHDKPLGLLEVDGYFASLLAFFDHAVAEGFLPAADRGLVAVDSDPGRLLDIMAERRAAKPGTS